MQRILMIIRAMISLDFTNLILMGATVVNAFGLQFRSTYFQMRPDFDMYSPIQPPLPGSRSHIECAGACAKDEQCVIFGFSPLEEICTLAGVPLISVPYHHTAYPDTQYYIFKNDCLGSEVVYFKAMSTCVEMLFVSSTSRLHWDDYSSLCSGGHQGSLLDLSSTDRFNYFTSAIFASPHYNNDKMWVGARGQPNGSLYNIVWVNSSRPVDPALWDASVSLAVPSGGGGGDDDDDDDDESGSWTPPDKCAFLEKTGSGVSLKLADCEANLVGEFHGLCEINP